MRCAPSSLAVSRSPSLAALVKFRGIVIGMNVQCYNTELSGQHGLACMLRGGLRARLSSL
jgi:hypothetical protein